MRILLPKKSLDVRPLQFTESERKPDLPEIASFTFRKVITNYNTYTDTELVNLLHQNDTWAFEELYKRYRSGIYSYAMVLVKFPDIAEDLVHDVFLKLWNARHKLAITSTFKNYLFRICHNRACDLHVDTARNLQLRNRLATYYAEEETVIFDRPSTMTDHANILSEALSTLTPQRRRIYEMCKIDRKSYDEVARELHISPNTVKNHLVQSTLLLSF